jgi:urea transport system permease protein
VPGAVVGALLVGFLKSWLSETFPQIWLYFLGAIFIVVVVAMPNGLAGLFSNVGDARRAKESP